MVPQLGRAAMGADVESAMREASAVSKLKIPALISYGDMVYRPAGYRVPRFKEQYVGTDGHIHTCQPKKGNPPRVGMLIVRPYSPEDFNGAISL